MASKNLFFSYYHKYKDSFDKILDMLNIRPYFGYSASHYNEDSYAQNEEYIKRLLRPKIDWAGTIVVLVGPGTYTRDWVNQEIEYAAGQNKRIVGVYLWGQSSSRIPAALSGHGHALVRWNTESIVAAIRGEDRWDTGD